MAGLAVEARPAIFSFSMLRRTALFGCTLFCCLSLTAKVLVESNLFTSTGDFSKLIINEIMPSNLDMFLDPSWNYGGWVELYNPTTEAVSLNGVYVSDDANDIRKFQLPMTYGYVPPQGYANIWFDHYDKNFCRTQVDFKLNMDGGTIFLSDYTGNTTLQMSYPPVFARCSWSRKTLNGNDWAWTSTPTPQASNSTSKYATVQAQVATPVINKTSQLFKSSLLVSASASDGALVRYTTDGSTPSLTNGKDMPPSLYVSTTMTLRFRAFKDDMLPSGVVTRSFIKKEYDFKIPVISIVATDSNLYGSTYGTFGTGPNGKPGRGSKEKVNWNNDWDRPCNFELLDTAGNVVISQEVDIAPSGGCSRGWMPTPFKLTAKKEYGGINYFDYPIFDRKSFLKYKNVKGRNGGNDWFDRFRDPALQMIVGRSGLNIDYQEYNPVQHYINGVYKGVINLRENNNKHFVEPNHGWTEEEIDMFDMEIDSGYLQKYGDRASFDRWMELSKQCGTSDAAYEELCSMVDVEEVAYYLAVELYLCNGDWPFNNIKGYRPRVEGGKYRIILFDLDGCLSIDDPFVNFEKHRKRSSIVAATVFWNMLQNAHFRKLFIDAFCMISGSVFEQTRVKQIASNLYYTMLPEFAFEGKTPSYSYNLIINKLTSAYQLSLVDKMRSYFSITNQPAMTGKASANIADATLYYNNLPVPTNKFEGKVQAPVTLKATAPQGYVFKGWKTTVAEMKKTYFEKSSSWKYYDKGSLDGTAWKSTTFDDSGWKEGRAPLGFGDNASVFNTVLDYGSATDKRPTYYMRKTINLATAPAADYALKLDYGVDDGCVVYVNGTEAMRYRMGELVPVYSDYAAKKSMGSPDMNVTTLAANLFRQGTNVIAVEVHNYSATDPDLYWDASLTVSYSLKEDERIVSTNPEYTLPEFEDFALQAIFEKDEPAWATRKPIRINEVSASNEIYINDYWKKNDWIELYNTTDEAVDVAGMYVSDNIAEPLKYRIPTYEKISTVIPAHGYLVVWCDKLEPLTQLHSNFKLSGEEGYVLLTDADELWSDTLHYCEQALDQTVGRFPDGYADVFLMKRPTIGASNVLTMCDETHIQPTPPTAVEEIEIAEGEVIRTEYYSINGMRITYEQALHAPSGIYICREYLSDGTVRSKKVLVK